MSPSENALAFTAHDGKSCRRRFDFCTRQSHGPSADVTANCLPYFIVPMFETGDGMSDLVQDRVSHFVFLVKTDEMAGQLNRLGLLNVTSARIPFPTNLCAADL